MTPAASASAYERTRPVWSARVREPAQRAASLTPRIEPLTSGPSTTQSSDFANATVGQ